MKAKVFLIFLVLLSSFCYAQSSGIDQRLLGTWVDINNGSILVFSGDGTGINSADSIIPSRFFWGVDGNRLFIFKGPDNLGNYAGLDKVARLFFISNDAGTLILSDSASVARIYKKGA